LVVSEIDLGRGGYGLFVGEDNGLSEKNLW